MSSSNFFERYANGIDSWFQSMGPGEVLVFILGLLAVVLVLCFISYIFTAFAFYAMAKKLNIEYPWLVFLPVVNMYILGKIVGDKVSFFGQEVKDLSIVLIITTIASGFVSQLPYIGVLLLLAYYVFIYFIYYKLYRIFKPESATTLLILSILFSIIQPFILFAIRNGEPNMTVFEE